MEKFGKLCIRGGAAAAMMCAAAVHAAAAQSYLAASETAAPALSLSASAGLSSPGTVLAQRAAKTIRSLDRLSGAQPVQPGENTRVSRPQPPTWPADYTQQALSIDPSRGTYQHSAP